MREADLHGHVGGTKTAPVGLCRMTHILQRIASLLLIGGLCACQPASQQQQPANGAAPTPVPNANAVQAAAEPTPQIDPKGPDAAVGVARDYYALIEARHFDQAADRIAAGPDAPALQARYGRFTGLKAGVGPAGESEGAAGSIYITVPARIAATGADGTDMLLTETVTLRRVNDVPGSTAEQRRWHIQSVAWDAPDKRGQ